MLRDRARQILEAAGVESELVVLKADGSFEGDPADIEVLLFALGVTDSKPAMSAMMSLLETPSLRFLQGPGAGVDHPLWQRLIDRGVRLTNASGIHAEPIAQYIFTYILHWERNVARHQAQQAEKSWEIIRSGDLGARTLGIIGYGGIGQATARIGRAFGMRVWATRRSPCQDPVLDRFVSLDSLDSLLAEADYVVLCMPYNDETRGMIGGSALERMHEDAVLINVARGGVVDEPALIEALQSGGIRGATLDVVSEEPLPPESPLWSLPNCVITPHDAGYSPLGDERLGALFLENLDRFVQGEPLVNEVLSTGFAAARD